MGRKDAIPTHVCREPGCFAGTNDGKSHCPEHLTRLPYVQRVLAGLQDESAQAVLVECSECGADFETLPSIKVKNTPGRCPACRKRYESEQTKARKARRAS